MKILLPFQDPYDHEITHPMCSGGIERFCKNICEVFDNTEVYQIPYKSTKKFSTSLKWETSRKIINKAEEVGADIIISNFPQTIFAGRELIKSPNIPILLIEHCFYPMMGTAIHRWNQAIDAGHSLRFVSEFQEKKYKDVSIRQEQRKLPISGYINPSYCESIPNLVPIEYDCGTIGRADSGKAPFKLKTMTKGSDISTLVCTSKTLLYEDENYYRKNNSPLGWYYKSVLTDTRTKCDVWDNVLWNEPYDVVIENIAKCGTYFSTWINETWGITSLEALSCGVPIILNCNKDGDHASETIPALPNHYVKIKNNDKDELIKAIKSFKNIDRKEVQEATLEKHSLKKWKSDFEDIISMAIDRFKKVRVT